MSKPKETNYIEQYRKEIEALNAAINPKTVVLANIMWEALRQKDAKNDPT